MLLHRHRCSFTVADDNAAVRLPLESDLLPDESGLLFHLESDLLPDDSIHTGISKLSISSAKDLQGEERGIIELSSRSASCLPIPSTPEPAAFCRQQLLIKICRRQLFGGSLSLSLSVCFSGSGEQQHRKLFGAA